jgi:hypothetical protein
MYDRDTALRHQIEHIAITQFISDIPTHGLNDEKMVEMAAFEECGLLRSELWRRLSIIIKFAPEPPLPNSPPP